MFCVVEFEKKECATVPLSWLLDENSQCYWPRASSDEAFIRFVKEQKEPRLTWAKYSVRKVHYITESYEDAESYLHKVVEQSTSSDTACNTSDRNNVFSLKTLTSDDETRSSFLIHKRSRRDISQESSSEEDDSTPIKTLRTLSSSQQLPSLQLPRQRYQTSIHSPSSTPTPTSQLLKQHQTLCLPSPSSASPTSQLLSQHQHQTLSLHSPSSTPSSTSLASTITVNTESLHANNYPIEGMLLKNNQAFSEFIVKTLETVMAIVNQNSEKLNEILRIQAQQGGLVEIPNNMPHFPIGNKKEFKATEEFLKSEENYQYLKCRLACIGGNSVRSCVMNMLKFLLTNKYAMKYNWAGRDKRPFKDTSLAKIVGDAVRQSFKGHAHDNEVYSAIKDWLKLAKSRHEYSQRKVPQE